MTSKLQRGDHHYIVPLILTGLALFTVVMLSGCKQMVEEPFPMSGDRLRLVEGSGSHAVAESDLAAGGARLSDDAAAIVDDYRRRGTGPLLLTVSAGDAGTASAWGRNLSAALAAKGLAEGELIVNPQVTDRHGAQVSFRAVDVLLPDCAAEPDEAGVNPGCAIERQIGLMTARPADLLGRGGSGAYDSVDGALAVQRQRTREVDTRPSITEDVRTTD
jgi:type IV pilus biogenesis protein CpaD/CtpE